MKGFSSSASFSARPSTSLIQIPCHKQDSLVQLSDNPANFHLHSQAQRRVHWNGDVPGHRPPVQQVIALDQVADSVIVRLYRRTAIGTNPSVGGNRPAVMFSNVDLPHPEGPTVKCHGWPATCQRTWKRPRIRPVARQAPPEGFAVDRQFDQLFLVASSKSPPMSTSLTSHWSYSRAFPSPLASCRPSVTFHCRSMRANS